MTSITTPAVAKKIPFAKPWITNDDRQAVLDVLHRDVLTHGPEGKHFEEEFAQYLAGEAYCVSLSSGMAALHLAYLQLGIGPGDEVIVPAQTHIATAHAVEWVGAKPVFADCDSATGNIDPAIVERLITDKTKAIGLVHFLGVPCDMGRIMALALKHNLKVIEDCAIALGSRVRGTHVGLIGDCGAFSFYPVKHITTGDGGMFVTKHKALAEKVNKCRGFGVDRTFAERTIPGMYDVPTLGLNYRMSDINAALGRRQLARLPDILADRRENFYWLKEALGEGPWHILDAPEDDTTNSFYCLSVILKSPLSNRRNEIVQRLNAAGVGTSVYYPQPVPRMTYYKTKYGYDAAQFPNAAAISDQGIALPVGPHLKAADLEYIATQFKSITKEITQ
jgi:perosamine synthetase